MAITTTHSRMIGDLDAGSTYATTASLGTAAPLDVGTGANNVVQLNGSSQLPAVDGSLLTGISTTVPVIVLRDEQSSGTGGGTATSGSWLTRVLNTESTDTGNHCTLSSNQFTLSAGTYEVSASASFFRTKNSQIKIYNTTDASDVIIGQVANAIDNGGNYSGATAVLLGYFTVAASKALELQYRIENTTATVGLGNATSWGTEVYAQVMLRKVG